MNAFKLTLLVAVLAAGSAFAQPQPDDTLYRQLGGQSGLVKLTDDFMQRLLADPRMNPFFKDTDQKEFKAQLAAQFCEVSGGPCQRKGKDMKTVHDGQDITKSNFNALVEVLQQSMAAQGIPFTAQNRLLAKLAPMHREIINKH
ncbi:group 1 truncated hemoglobin [Rhizobacter sp. Root404]|uniref:group I truncated hemoglobin n=1 Tax=Rhizobacter sp. Root404 TaxID=1736528 RepID=UPI0006F8D7C6|nr:group 1 truncated hemoglobin [Rhizobacter sp. Root404]KQW38082.1 globin [Rhizobacter sp. Root404]